MAIKEFYNSSYKKIEGYGSLNYGWSNPVKPSYGITKEENAQSLSKYEADWKSTYDAVVKNINDAVSAILKKFDNPAYKDFVAKV
ncbi:MAG: hypothetical protein ACKPKO_36435, partial [Candidatus Fonsibacter sp.]